MEFVHNCPLTHEGYHTGKVRQASEPEFNMDGGMTSFTYKHATPDASQRETPQLVCIRHFRQFQKKFAKDIDVPSSYNIKSLFIRRLRIHAIRLQYNKTFSESYVTRESEARA